MHYLLNFRMKNYLLLLHLQKFCNIYIHLIVIDFINYCFKYLIDLVRTHKISVQIVYLVIN